MPGYTPAVYVNCRECRTCKTVQLLNQFSRRGVGYRLDCKSCEPPAWRPAPRPLPPADQSKRCSKCKQVKPRDQFSHRGDSREGRYRSACKACEAERGRKRYQDPETRAKHKILRDRWRAENPGYFAENYQQNREKRIADAVEYAKLNPVDPEHRRQVHRAWYAANRETRQAVKRAWQENNAERVREYRRRSASRRRARLRSLPAEVYTMDQILERDGSDCVLCSGELDLDAVYPEPLAPSVEHLECISWPDVTAGDVLSNVGVSHWQCNNERRARPHPEAARKRAELLAAELAVRAAT